MGKTLLEFQPNKGDVLPPHRVRLLSIGLLVMMVVIQSLILISSELCPTFCCSRHCGT
jgi:hypothetical protein